VDEDDQLFEELRRAADLVDPVPERLLASADVALTFRTFETELAELVFDSTGREAGAAVRGAAAPRVLSFHAAGRGIELEVLASSGSLELVGQLQPPGAADIEVIGPAGVAGNVTADELGRFATTITPPDLFCLRVRSTAADARTVTTEWISP